jgi:hypothetical protein
MLKAIVVLTGIALGLIAGSASAVLAQTATWRLEDVTCEGRNCSARLVSVSGEIIEIAGRGLLMTTNAAKARLVELNAEVEAGQTGNG